MDKNVRVDEKAMVILKREKLRRFEKGEIISIKQLIGDAVEKAYSGF